MKKFTLLMLVLLVCGIGTANATIYGSYDPEITELNWGSGTQANDINNAGQVTGTAWNSTYAFMRNANGDRSYLYAQTAAGVGSHGRTYGNAINAIGEVIATGSGTITGLTYRPLLYTSITPPAHGYDPLVIGASGDRGRAINTQYVAGYTVGSSASDDATIWDFDGNQVYQVAAWSHARYVDASANNVFIGNYVNPTSGDPGKSFITTYDSVNDLWSNEVYYFGSYVITQLQSINGDGSVFCGYLKTAMTSDYTQAAVFGYDTGGNIVRLANLAQSNSVDVRASAVSQDGKIILGVDENNNAVVWESTDTTWSSYTKYTFESLLPTAEQGLWTNVVLTGVNDSGTIVGYGNYNGQTYQSGFVLVPEPATMFVVLSGACFALLRKRR